MRLDAFGFQYIPEPIGIVAAVAGQSLCLGHIIGQHRRTGTVTNLGRCHIKKPKGQPSGCLGRYLLGRDAHAEKGENQERPKAKRLRIAAKPLETLVDALGLEPRTR